MQEGARRSGRHSRSHGRPLVRAAIYINTGLVLGRRLHGSRRLGLRRLISGEMCDTPGSTSFRAPWAQRVAYVLPITATVCAGICCGYDGLRALRRGESPGLWLAAAWLILLVGLIVVAGRGSNLNQPFAECRPSD